MTTKNMDIQRQQPPELHGLPPQILLGDFPLGVREPLNGVAGVWSELQDYRRKIQGKK